MNAKKIYVYAGFTWCFLFASISFYWAVGGMIGTKSLGASIYHLALEREPSFLAIVWLTGFIKLFGGVFLLLLLKEWSKLINPILYYVSLVGGIFLALYGSANSITLLFSRIGLLSFQVDNYTLKWRLLFWEPFWMLGGALFILSARAFRKK